MGYYENRIQRGGTNIRRLVISLILILIGVVACTVATFVGIDAVCRNDVETWLPVYPGAELVEQTYDFVRPHAMGKTTSRYFTPDDPQTVRLWYADTMQEIGKEHTSRGIASTRHFVREAPDGGSIIQLSSECAYN
jgi:hypothetical protein